MQLNVEIARTGYDDYNANIKYYFDEDHLINAGFRKEDNMLKVCAYNEDGVKLVMSIDSDKEYLSNDSVGEITNFDGSVRYADIFFGDGQLIVVWSDSQTSSILY